MTDHTDTQGPQALVLRSLLTAEPLPGSSYPARLGDLRLTLDETGAVRLLRDGLEQDTLDRLAATVQEAGGLAIAVVTLAELTGLDAPLTAAVRSRAEPLADGALRVTAEVCGVRGGQLQPWELCVVTLVRQGEDWVATEPPLSLST